MSTTPIPTPRGSNRAPLPDGLYRIPEKRPSAAYRATNSVLDAGASFAKRAVIGIGVVAGFFVMVGILVAVTGH